MEHEFITVTCPKCGHEQKVDVDQACDEAEVNGTEEAYTTCEECGERYSIDKWIGEMTYSLTPKGMFEVALSDAGIIDMIEVLEDEYGGIGRKVKVAFDLFEEYMYQNGFIKYDDKPDMTPDNPTPAKDLLRMSLEDAGIKFKPRQAEVAYTLFRMTMNKAQETDESDKKSATEQESTDKMAD